MGVLVGHFNILYEAFNNMTAAGIATNTYLAFNAIIAQLVVHLPMYSKGSQFDSPTYTQVSYLCA